MLNNSQCIKLAREKCVAMFGMEFVNRHKEEFCSTRYLDSEKGIFEYSLLWSPLEDIVLNNNGLSIGHKPFDYYASVIVDMNSGLVYKDPDEEKTKLPT